MSSRNSVSIEYPLTEDGIRTLREAGVIPRDERGSIIVQEALVYLRLRHGEMKAAQDERRRRGMPPDPMSNAWWQAKIDTVKEVEAEIVKIARRHGITEEGRSSRVREDLRVEVTPDDRSSGKNTPGKECGNCTGKGNWWARDPDTNEILRDTDGLRMVYECGRCKGSGKEPESP